MLFDLLQKGLSFPRNFVFQEMGYNAPVNWKETQPTNDLVIVIHVVEEYEIDHDYGCGGSAGPSVADVGKLYSRCQLYTPAGKIHAIFPKGSNMGTIIACP